ncbi:ABC transporter permease [Nocardia sp. CA2R105]|uniref:ABC transporter permease n=1 Tax=Nocardia coffeae TaxID=2873381 RepID=UPI001CA719CB|nr:ABC transporter permease [Nocardia coffeae]MBY8855036.1 ABC transporter permease [Nocardia coffeae]
MVTAENIEKTTRKVEAAAPARKRPKGAGWSNGMVVTMRFVVIVAVLAVWQLVSGTLIPDYAISRPTEVAVSLWNTLISSKGWIDIWATTVEVVVGFGLGILFGAVLGLLLGSFTTAGRVLEPLMAAINGIPKIALAPLFMLFFGIGAWSKITIAAMGVAFVMFYNLYLGLRQTDRELVQGIQMMGGRTHHVLFYVTIPTLASPFFAALKAGGPLAILGVIGGEFIASSKGVGHELFNSAMALDAAGEFAGLIILVVMTLILNGLLSQLDAYALKRLGLGARGPAQRT